MAATTTIEHWNPEDSGFWRRTGARVAARNLWLSVAALTLAFAVWMMWSVVVVQLPAAGFRYSTNQLFWLTALPALSGATLRFVYAFAVPVFGGRRWTTLATAVLLVPALGLGFAAQNPATPYEAMVGLALLCGLGGANFASSMAHVSFFYPKSRVGAALGLNAGLGNLGVPLAQLVVPLVVGVGLFGALGGAPQAGAQGHPVWLQNAGFVWVPFIAAATLAAWFGLDDLAPARGSFAEQAGIVLNRHNWLMCWLYAGTFGSFIGFAAAFPLLLASQFPGFDAAHTIWIGPLVGALARPLGGWWSDRVGGARVTLRAFAVMTLAVLVLWASLPGGSSSGRVLPMLASAFVLFAAAGVGNGSTFRMIALIFRHQRLARAGSSGQADLTPGQRHRAELEGNKEAAAALGFASAVAAYGGFFIPKSMGTAILVTGAPAAALLVFAAFYLTCIGITWWFYARRFAPMPC
jgi:MFS transporter, NNP family, nitrate/nitrite transporter